MADSESPERDLQVENDDSYRRTLSALFKNLRSQAISNAEYFQEGKSQNSERFHASFRRLYEHLDRGIEPGVECLLSVVHLYDFDAKTPANGYRSMTKIIHKCCLKILQLTRYITVNRTSFLFRSGHYSRELEAYVTTLGQLRACLYYVERLLSYSGGRQLFPDEETLSPQDFATAEQLMIEVETLCQETFYGRCLAFQYCESMARPLTTIVVAMASFADTHLTNSSMLKMASTILGSGKYIMDPELRAQQIVNVTRNGDIQFLKDFWSVAESDFLHQLPLYVCPQVAVDKVITIHPEAFELPRTDGAGCAKITPPCAHSGPFPVQTRLISYKLRQGQEQWFPKAPAEAALPPSPCLLLHCHGGGFVAQSSASHQVYLRHWAKDLNIPILSIDYSLAPEFPFPRQLEEIFFAYCWALKNHQALGWTGERVAFAGDSAGGNLIMATTMRALTLKVRPPDGLMSVYGVMLVRYFPSPSRIMALYDPLLSVGVMANCLAAYSGVGQSTLVSVPYYHGPNHRSSKTPTPATPRDIISPLVTSSPNAPKSMMTRHKSTTSGDSGFHDLLTKSESARSVRSRESETESDTTSDIRQTTTAESYDLHGLASSSVSPEARTDDALHGVAKTTMPIGDLEITQDTDSSHIELGSSEHQRSPGSDKENASNGDGDIEIDGATSSPGSPAESKPNSSQSDVSPSSASSPGSDGSPSEGKPKRSGMWLDFGGFFGLRGKGRQTHKRSPSSPALLSLVEDERTTTVDKKQLPPRSPFANVKNAIAEDAYNSSAPTYAQIRHFAQSPVVQFRHMPIAKNPYMSPYLAPDNLLRDMPPVYFQACHLDPMLDDSIAMAQRLRSLGREVHVTVHDDLPHGFLNFVLLSPEAKRGSDSIVQDIRRILHLDEVDWNEFDMISDMDIEDATLAMEINESGDGSRGPATGTMRTSMSAAEIPVHNPVNTARSTSSLQREGSMPAGFRVTPCAPCL